MYYPARDGFEFTAVFTDRFFKHIIDPSIIDIEIKQEVYHIPSNENLTLVTTPLPTKLCGSDFPYQNRELVESLNLQKAT